jgi:hypothetical protein
MKCTVQLNASDSLIEFEGDPNEAHEFARNRSAWAEELFKRHGFSVIDQNGRVQAIYRQGLRWKFRETDGRWVELPLFD